MCTWLGGLESGRAIFVDSTATELLLSARSDILAEDKWNLNALFLAVESKRGQRSSTIAMLLNANAPVNGKDHGRRTPLHVAAKRDDDDTVAVVQLLVNAGADKLARDLFDSTPADVAVPFCCALCF